MSASSGVGTVALTVGACARVFTPARCSLPQPAVLSGCIAAEQGASLGAALAPAPTTVVGTAKGITEALNMAQVLFGAVLIIFSVVWYLFTKHGQTPPSPRPEQGASFHEVYPASPNAEVRPTKQNKTESPVCLLSRTALIGSGARGTSKLNCATRGCREPCLVQFSLLMPRAMEPITGTVATQHPVRQNTRTHKQQHSFNESRFYASRFYAPRFVADFTHMAARAHPPLGPLREKGAPPQYGHAPLKAPPPARRRRRRGG